MLVTRQGGDAMFEYRNPEAILEVVLPDRTRKNDRGHTLNDDFLHFCDVTGCEKDDAWATLAFAWEWTARYPVAGD
jgi:hypothetical protein